MSNQPQLLNNQIGCVCLGVVVGVFATAIALLLGGYGWPGSIFLGLIAAGISSVLFLWIFCKPLPALNSEQAPAKPAAAPKPAAEKNSQQDAPEAASKPAAAASAAKTVSDDAKPATLAAARAEGPDNLKLIKGVGPKLEALLHRLGFFHFDQVASWTADEVAWVDENLEGFKGRVSRDEWVAQAKILAAGGQTEFSKKNKK